MKRRLDMILMLLNLNVTIFSILDHTPSRFKKKPWVEVTPL